MAAHYNLFWRQIEVSFFLMSGATHLLQRKPSWCGVIAVFFISASTDNRHFFFYGLYIKITWTTAHTGVILFRLKTHKVISPKMAKMNGLSL